MRRHAFRELEDDEQAVLRIKQGGSVVELSQEMLDILKRNMPE